MCFINFVLLCVSLTSFYYLTKCILLKKYAENDCRETIYVAFNT